MTDVARQARLAELRYEHQAHRAPLGECECDWCVMFALLDAAQVALVEERARHAEMEREMLARGAVVFDAAHARIAQLERGTAEIAAVCDVQHQWGQVQR